jgi:hypothetical protein
MTQTQFQLPTARLAYAKLSATPTPTNWSQVYNAGNLFICLSLATDTPSSVSLQTLGKNLFSNFQAEFFTLEEKTTESITTAIITSIKEIPDQTLQSFCLAYFTDQTLLIFLRGKGRIVMKRKESLGTLLKREDETQQILTASILIITTH